MNGRRWTKEEEKYLRKYCLSKPRWWIAQKLGKSENAIKQKIRTMELSREYEYLKVATLAACFNTTSWTVEKWIDKYNLPCAVKIEGAYLKGKRLPSKRLIDPEVFWEWAKENKGMIDWRNYENLSVLPQPEWVKDEIRLSSQNPKHPVNYRKPITKLEIRTILTMTENGKSNKEISEKVGRTVDSVKNIKRQKTCSRIF